MRLLRKAAVTFDRIIGILAFLAGVLLAYAMLSVDIEIITRFFTGRAQLWVVEVCEYILLLVTFLGATWVLKREEHVVMDVVVSRLEPRTQTILNIITSIIGAIVCLTIFWYGAGVTWENYQKGIVFYKAVGFPKAPIMAVIPIGCLLLSIQFLKRSSGYWGKWRALEAKNKGHT